MTKRTPENRARLIELRGTGATKAACAAAVLVSRDTLHEWLRDDEAFALEFEAAFQAEVDRRVASVKRSGDARPVKRTRTEFAPGKDRNGKPTGKLVKVSQTVEESVEEGDWRATAWWLERADPESYGRRETIRLVPPEKMTDEELLAAAGAVAARARGDGGDGAPGADPGPVREN